MERYVFFGTGANFSLKVFESLREHEFLPSMIVVPDYPPVKVNRQKVIEIVQPAEQNLLVDIARQLQIPLHYSPPYRDEETCNLLCENKLDFMLVACWPFKISALVYKAVSKAAMNLHPSLLPAYRGSTPVIDQLQNREKHLGVSLHLLSEEFDAGDIVQSQEFEMPRQAGIEEIEEIAASLGAEFFIEACRQYGGPEWCPRPQL